MNWVAYEKGYRAWDKYRLSGWINRISNPYKKGSENWKSWNRGWNMNLSGLTDIVVKTINIQYQEPYDGSTSV